MKLYRLEDASRPRIEQAFAGLGGLYASGRWHTLGRRIVYTSASLALASLEKLVHAHSLRALTQLNYFEITVPDALIEEARECPPDWNRDPVTATSQLYGDRWLAEQRSPALLVPSAIIPVEYNCLLNPSHPAFEVRWINGPTAFDYDPRIKAACEIGKAAGPEPPTFIACLPPRVPCPNSIAGRSRRHSCSCVAAGTSRCAPMLCMQVGDH